MGDHVDQPDAGHREFEQLAIEHVLGGLTTDASSRFRDHLIDCSHCRRHVAELRAIASDLQQAERQERAVVRTKPATDRDDPPQDPVRSEHTLGQRLRSALIVLLALTLSIVAFWDMHHRNQRDQAASLLSHRESALAVFLEGESIPVITVDPEINLEVAATLDRVAVIGSGLRRFGQGQVLTLWGRSPNSDNFEVIAQAGVLDVIDGRFVIVGELGGRTHLELSINRANVPPDRGERDVVLFTANVT